MASVLWICVFLGVYQLEALEGKLPTGKDNGELVDEDDLDEDENDFVVDSAVPSKTVKSSNLFATAQICSLYDIPYQEGKKVYQKWQEYVEGNGIKHELSDAVVLQIPVRENEGDEAAAPNRAKRFLETASGRTNHGWLMCRRGMADKEEEYPAVCNFMTDSGISMSAPSYFLELLRQRASADWTMPEHSLISYLMDAKHTAERVVSVQSSYFLSAWKDGIPKQMWMVARKGIQAFSFDTIRAVIDDINSMAKQDSVENGRGIGSASENSKLVQVLRSLYVKGAGVTSLQEELGKKAEEAVLLSNNAGHEALPSSFFKKVEALQKKFKKQERAVKAEAYRLNKQLARIWSDADSEKRTVTGVEYITGDGKQRLEFTVQMEDGDRFVVRAVLFQGQVLACEYIAELPVVDALAMKDAEVELLFDAVLQPKQISPGALVLASWLDSAKMESRVVAMEELPFAKHENDVVLFPEVQRATSFLQLIRALCSSALQKRMYEGLIQYCEEYGEGSSVMNDKAKELQDKEGSLYKNIPWLRLYYSVRGLSDERLGSALMKHVSAVTTASAVQMKDLPVA